MPSFQMYTNVPEKDIPESFNEELTEALMFLLQKDKKFVLIQVIPDQRTTFAGTNEPCAMAELCCVGGFSKELNQRYSAVLCEKISKNLEIPADRMYICFSDMKGENIGWNGRTFAK